jgi:subtilisin family serine protease
VLQTFWSERFEDPNEDDDPGGHGTEVASKALGQINGIAKGATLISVKLRYEIGEIMFAFTLIKHDLLNRRLEDGKALNAVVVCTVLEPEIFPDPDVAKKSRKGQNLIRVLDSIHSEGVPIVFASGNAGDISGRENIDNYPQVLEGPGTPIINVGGTTLQGDRWGKSQGGPQLTIYAPGEDVGIQGKLDGKDGESLVAGTSVGKLPCIFYPK